MQIDACLLGDSWALRNLVTKIGFGAALVENGGGERTMPGILVDQYSLR